MDKDLAIIWSIVFLFLVASIIAIKLNERHAYVEKFKARIRQSPMPRWWMKVVAVVRIIAGILAAIVFAASLAVNICSWVWKGIAQYMNWLMLLHLAVLAIFFVAFAATPKKKVGQTTKRTLNLPGPAQTIMTALSIYAAAVFALEMFGLITEGKFKSETLPHNQIELEKSPKRLQEEAHVLRFFSGLWMVFSFGAGAHLLFDNKDQGPFGKFNSVVKRIG